jgi:hypothetical protein
MSMIANPEYSIASVTRWAAKAAGRPALIGKNVSDREGSMEGFAL